MASPNDEEPTAQRSGVAGAMRFLAAVRSDQELRARIERLGPDGDLSAVAAIAADFGFTCSEEHLRQAHRHDWGLRRARYLVEERDSRSP